LTRLHADTFHDNPASARVLEKAGFNRESVKRRAAIKFGEIKDLNVYVMLR
jgi:RimJ/RimL family protein N-acetyltransferase